MNTTPLGPVVPFVPFVMVAYDGSSDADDALLWAAAEARATHAPLRVVVVDDVPTSPWSSVAAIHGQQVLERAEKALTDSGSVEVTVERHVGHVMEQLLRVAGDASTLVVGSRGHGAAADLLVGSVSQHLARHATCPVVVVRPARAPQSRRIVVGIDGSPLSAAALEFACRRAERTGETVVALHAWHAHVPSTDVWAADPRPTVGLEERQALLSEAVAGVRVDHPDVRLELEAVPVGPARCLVDASRAASLVVVGSRGLEWFSGLLMGSVSQAVLQGAACPVAVVR